jgi:hypothetical protein
MNASKEPKASKRGAAGTIRDITLTIPETLEIIRKPGSATSQSFIMAAYDTGFLTNYGIRKHKKKITCKNLGQQRYCLTNGIYNNLAPLPSFGCEIK